MPHLIFGSNCCSDADFAPTEETRSTPIAAIILTSADIDCVLGFLHLREFQPLHIYATRLVLRVLTEENTLFRTLERSVPPVIGKPLPLDRPIPILNEGTSEMRLASPAKPCRSAATIPDYVSDRPPKESCAEKKP